MTKMADICFETSIFSKSVKRKLDFVLEIRFQQKFIFKNSFFHVVNKRADNVKKDTNGKEMFNRPFSENHNELPVSVFL